jgi:small subunit ribosomal protein S6
MKSYEGVFIFPPDSAPDARKSQFKNLDDLFAKYQVEVLQKMEWGKRQLGYHIRKHSEGHFLIIDFKMDPAKTVEFRKSLELFEDVIKFMITVKNTQPEKKAAKTAAAKPAHSTAAHPAPTSA